MSLLGWMGVVFVIAGVVAAVVLSRQLERAQWECPRCGALNQGETCECCGFLYENDTYEYWHRTHADSFTGNVTSEEAVLER